jgi:hypothetical protein
MVPLYLLATLAAQAICAALKDRSSFPVELILGLVAVVVVSAMATPGAVMFWHTVPEGGPVLLAVMALLTGLVAVTLRRSMRTAFRFVLVLVIALLMVLCLTTSAIIWLFFPFSLAFLPFAGLFLFSAVAVGAAQLLLVRPPAADLFETGRRTVRLILLALLAGSVVDAALYAMLKARTQTIVHRMEWQWGGTTDAGGETKTVLADPTCSALTSMVESDEVAHYLEASGTNTVPVTYLITEDFGRIWSYTIQAVGPVRVQCKSNDMIRKEKDVECAFQEGS